MLVKGWADIRLNHRYEQHQWEPEDQNGIRGSGHQEVLNTRDLAARGNYIIFMSIDPPIFVHFVVNKLVKAS